MAKDSSVASYLRSKAGAAQRPASSSAAVASGLGSAYADPAKGQLHAKAYFRHVLEGTKQAAQPAGQPQLDKGPAPQASAKVPAVNGLVKPNMSGWHFNQGTGNLNHGLHGSITVRPGAQGGFEAVHNGALIGKFGDRNTVGAKIVDYISKLPKGQAQTRMANMPSGAVKSELNKDGEPGSPNNPNSQSNQGGIQMDPDRAKAIRDSFNGATGSAGLARNWQNLKDAVGMGKSQSYFRDLLKKSENKA